MRFLAHSRQRTPTGPWTAHRVQTGFSQRPHVTRVGSFL